MGYFIELGNSQYKIVDAVMKKDKITINSFNTVYTMVDQESLQQIVSGLVDKKTKNTTIIANNAGAFYRELKIPMLDEKKSLQIIRNELKMSQTLTQETLIDYVDLGTTTEGNLRKVLVCGLPVAQTETYSELLKNIKCKKVRSIEVSYGSLFNYIANTSIEKTTSPYVTVEVINGMLRVILFENKKFVLARSARISYDDYAGIVNTIIEEIGMMQQFQLTRHFQSKIENVYLFGDYNGIQVLVQELTPKLQMNIDVLPEVKNLTAPDDFNYLSYVYVLGSLVGNPKVLNFSTLYKEYTKEQKSMDPTKKKILISTIAGVVVVAGAYAGLYYINEETKKGIEAEVAFTSDEKLLSKVSTVIDEEMRIATYQSIGREVDSAQANLDLIPYVNQYLVQTLYGYEGASVGDFSSENGIFTLQISSADAHMPTYYADHLRNSGIFDQVDFKGVDLNDETKKYTFTIVAEMKRGE